MPTELNLPHAVLSRIRIALNRMQGLADALAAGRQTDNFANGQGRYEYDAHINFGSVSESLATLAEFERLAPGNGVDPQIVYRALGGKPDIRLSQAAQQWADED